MAMTQGLIDSYWRKYNQRRALTGLPSSYQEQRGMLDPIMEAAANKDIQESQLRYQNERSNRQLSMQEQAQKDASRAASISGATNLATLGASGYLGYQALQKPTIADYLMTQRAAETTKASNDLLATGWPGTAPTATAATPTATAGIGSGGEGILGGVGSGAVSGQSAVGGGSALGISGPEAAYAGTEGFVAGPSATTSGFGSYALPIAAGFAIHQAAMPFLKKVGSEVKGLGEGSSIDNSIKKVTDPTIKRADESVGKVLNNILGDQISNALDVSLVCSELLRQGRITERDRAKCVVFRARHINHEMFCAYLEWASPIVSVMRKGGLGNRVLLPFAHAFIRYMIAIQLGIKPTFMERTVWKYAWWRCEGIARRQGSFTAEVA